jgi:hypothetical protein
MIAVNIAKLPSVPRQILKDIPRPPNSVVGQFELPQFTGFWEDALRRG